MAGFASLDDLKVHLDKTDSRDDSELLLMLDAANELVGSIVGSFDAVTVSEQAPVTSGTVLLSGKPVGSVTVTDPTGAAIDGFTVNAAAGLLRGVSTYYSYVNVTYDAGDGVVPAAVMLATLIIAAHLWETQRDTASPSPLAVQSAETDFPLNPGVGFAIPNRAKELLEPFIRSRQIA